MFQPLRKPERQMSKEFVDAILDGADYGVLSLITEDGYPYGVPISFVHIDGSLYFHGGKAGLKYKSALENPKACFTIVTKHLTLPKQYTVAYQSVIAFGKISFEEDKDEITQIFCDKYTGPHKEEAKRRIQAGLDYMALYKFEIEHITGKERPEFKGK